MKNIYFLFCLSFFTTINAQPTINTFGGIGNDSGSSIIETSEGDLLILGTTQSFENEPSDILLTRTNQYGEQIWANTYGGDSTDYAIKIIEASDGQYIILGNSSSSIEGDNDLWLIKIDEGGQIIWDYKYGGDEDEHAINIVETSDFGYMILASDTTLFMIKTNNSGVQQWSNPLLSSSGNISNTLNLDYIPMQKASTDNAYLFLINNILFTVDELGDVINERHLSEDYPMFDENVSNGFNGTICLDFIETSSSIFFVGRNRDYIQTQWYPYISFINVQAFIIKEGTYSFLKTYSLMDWNGLVTNNNWSSAMFGQRLLLNIDEYDNLVVCSPFFVELYAPQGSGTQTYYDIKILKMDSFGNIQWEKTFGGTQEETLNDVLITSDQGVAILGTTDSYGAGGEDLLFIKLNEDGEFNYLSSYEESSPNHKSILRTIDILGRDVTNIYNTPIIEIYDDGSSLKKIILEM